MVAHEQLIADIEDHGIRFLDRIDELKSFLAFARTPIQEPVWLSSSQDARALAIVCTMAELEALTRSILQETHDELNSCSIEVKSLVPSVRQVVAHRSFESLRSLQDAGKVWTQRSYTTTLETCIEMAEFPVERKHAQPPLDGSTLKPEHFYRLWEIYSLPGTAFPKIEWSGALQKMANARNDLAHGNLPYRDIFKQAGRSLADIEQYVDQVGSIGIHFGDTWCDYLRNERYLRS